VQKVATDLSATPSQVAIAWTRAKSPRIHPILGARRLEQLTDNLGAIDVQLDATTIAQLDEASHLELGFPHDFIRDTASFVYGAAGEQVDERP
jgi:aryl-alcohol dehydrogenase-like predicted oxidoreductase